MIVTSRLKIYAASQEQMEAFIAAQSVTEESNIASQRVLNKARFLPTGEMGEEGPVFARRKAGYHSLQYRELIIL